MPLSFFFSLLASLSILFVSLTQISSGLARTFGRAAFARPAPVARRALQPRFPSLARFASTEATQAGKIHQVIGAVVDGMLLALVLPPCLAFFADGSTGVGIGMDGRAKNLFWLQQSINHNHHHSNSRLPDTILLAWFFLVEF